MKAGKLMRAGVCASALAGAAFALATAGQPGITLIRAGAHRHDPIQGRHHVRGGDWTSTNWSGYAVTGANGSATDVKGSWTVPQVLCSQTPGGYSSFWAGIDGFNSSTVEQIGTDSDCVSLTGQTGTPTYYAWFEFYPKGAYLIGNYSRNGACNADCIFPGDSITAEVKYGGGLGPKGRGGNSFTVTITDSTRHWSFSTSSTVNAQQSSVEWIAEAPWSGGVLPLADFGQVNFTGSQATMGGTTGSITAFPTADIQKIDMATSSGTLKDSTSGLSKTGENFSVTWLSAGP